MPGLGSNASSVFGGTPKTATGTVALPGTGVRFAGSATVPVALVSVSLTSSQVGTLVGQERFVGSKALKNQRKTF